MSRCAICGRPVRRAGPHRGRPPKWCPAHRAEGEAAVARAYRARRRAKNAPIRRTWQAMASLALWTARRCACGVTYPWRLREHPPCPRCGDTGLTRGAA